MKFTPYKNRTLEIGQRVEVYRNLHTNLFSIRDKATKLVLGHAKDFYLTNALPKVSKRGQERVRHFKQRNVHAWVEGDYKGHTICLSDEVPLLRKITYNPYLDESFRFVGDCNKPLGSTFYFTSTIAYASVTSIDST